MTNVELKTNFHKLIDSINNENLLFKFYEIISKTSESKDGTLWSRLNNEELQELLLIEQESRDDKNLIAHSNMITKHKKWL